ncbi:MAG: hypothetical protein V4538_16215 [Bacteroidota bacterium]
MYKNGDIFICRGKSDLSAAIMTATQSNWSHTAQAQYINGILCIVDAQKEGFFPRRFDKWFLEFGYEFEVYRAPEIDEAKYCEIVTEMFGSDYCFKLLALGFWRKLLFGRTVKEKYGHDNKYVCGEGTMTFLKVLGYNVSRPENFTPNDVREWCIANGFKLIK